MSSTLINIKNELLSFSSLFGEKIIKFVDFLQLIRKNRKDDEVLVSLCLILRKLQWCGCFC